MKKDTIKKIFPKIWAKYGSKIALILQGKILKKKAIPMTISDFLWECGFAEDVIRREGGYVSMVTKLPENESITIADMAVYIYNIDAWNIVDVANISIDDDDEYYIPEEEEIEGCTNVVWERDTPATLFLTKEEALSLSIMKCFQLIEENL